MTDRNAPLKHEQVSAVSLVSVAITYVSILLRSPARNAIEVGGDVWALFLLAACEAIDMHKGSRLYCSTENNSHNKLFAPAIYAHVYNLMEECWQVLVVFWCGRLPRKENARARRAN